MYKLLPITIVALFCALCVRASTVISSASVAGRWSLSGSPYLVYNNITVDDTSSLTIDPGVQVIFQGVYSLTVNGILHAAGNAAMPISFTVADTTGFSTDLISPAGGWHGIRINAYTGRLPDATTLEYCNLSFMKFDTLDYHAGRSGLFCGRKMTVTHCDFYNVRSQVGLYAYQACPLLTNYTEDTFRVTYCNFYNNIVSTVWQCSGSLSGICYVDNNKFHHNTCYNYPILIAFVTAHVQNNEIHDITQIEGHYTSAGVITASNIAGTIAHNKIYNNATGHTGAVYAYFSQLNIEGNLICNNQTGIRGCGATDGGAGIFITGGGTGYRTPFYTITNNVIANNYCYSWGGGICMQYINGAIIANNQLVNNTASLDGGAMLIRFDSQVVIKNNLIEGNISSAQSVDINYCENIRFENNWLQHGYLGDVVCGDGSIIGDSATNITGITPGMIDPTHTPDVTESALSHNFSLLPTSVCINRGDTALVSLPSTDYSGNARLVGGLVDIGAYENSESTLNTAKQTAVAIALYPNPASNILFISLPKAVGEIELVDVAGHRAAIYKVAVSPFALDVSAMPRGIFIAKWHTDRGEYAEKMLELK